MAHGRPPAIFIADAPALDFLNSVATPIDVEIDWIEDGEGFLEWLQQAQLVPPHVLKALRARAMPGQIDNVAAHRNRCCCRLRKRWRSSPARRTSHM
jgi:hypothetical protein